MKKLTRRGFTAAGIIAALSAGLSSLTGCDLDLVSCSPASLYGPPPEDIDPSNNEVVDVYGPPDVDPSDWDDPDTWDDPESDDGYDEEDNIAITLYGPPVTDEGDEYDAEDNMMQLMYGPMQVYDPDDAD